MIYNYDMSIKYCIILEFLFFKKHSLVLYRFFFFAIIGGVKDRECKNKENVSLEFYNQFMINELK